MHKTIQVTFVIWLLPCIRAGLLDLMNITDRSIDPDQYADQIVGAIQTSIGDGRFQLMRSALERELSGRMLRVITIEVNPMAFLLRR